MKKIIACMLVIIMAVALCGCGNMSMGYGNFTYRKIHIDTPHYGGCILVDKWYETSTGVEVKTEDYGNIFFSEGTYMLIEDDCPLCS